MTRHSELRADHRNAGTRHARSPHALKGARVVPVPETETLWENLREGRPIDADLDGTGEEPPADAPEEPGNGDDDPSAPPGGPAPVEPEPEPTPECTP
ncbi:hypothetical protein [Bogoriella caseilytica]|uniref:Uncharacterized protein n=1 Tax=Bogoriella caseilytica TaxID=56055 RepID=A0A3N2BD62_9MICO|nr:hypothetical protein [Bogoriella caseilytica]ROR72994.1 hypothetical protein EDD31_1359 [Bogoriella caseilytica]